MSLADSADSAPQLVALCRDAADGKAEALDRVLAVVSSGNQERFQSALALTPCIMELFEASSKEQDDRCRVLTLILCALHNRTCATNPAPASFQVPWPLSIRGQGLGSLSEEHVRAITTHKIALRSVVSCHALPSEASSPAVTWPLVETLCCSCLCSLFDLETCDRRDSSSNARRMVMASSILRLAQRASTGTAPPFLSSRLSVSMCMLVIKIIPPHAVAPAAANGSFLPQSAPVSSQPTNSSPASTSTDLDFSVSAQDERALANTCCAAGQAWHLLSQISLDTDLFLCSSVLLDGPMGLEIQM